MLELPYKGMLFLILGTTIMLAVIQIIIADYLRVLMDSLVSNGDFPFGMFGVMLLIFGGELGLIYYRTLSSEKICREEHEGFTKKIYG